MSNSDKPALREHQVEGVKWMYQRFLDGRGCILGDEMGLGKTAQAIELLNCIKEDTTDKKCQFLILSPLSVLNNWQTELARFGPDLTGIVYSGSKEDRELLRGNLVAQMKILVSIDLLTAYYGLLDICSAKEGDTVYVNSAAGAVGSVVGQIAKIKGLKVVGSAGSDEKVAWLKELGFDEAFNYKTVGNMGEALKKYCPKGIDCFFENVGGDAFMPTLELMNQKGRIGVCGAIAGYNDESPVLTPLIHRHLVGKSIRIEGFLVTALIRDPTKLRKAMADMIGWYKEGKLKTKENILDGFERMPEAFITMLKGGGYGKFLVKV